MRAGVEDVKTAWYTKDPEFMEILDGIREINMKLANTDPLRS